jgi:hypothetical protein
MITAGATASDNFGVAGVQFHLDGAPLGPEDTTAPYAVVWNTFTASNAAHILTAVARDTAGNRTTSAPVTVTVDNTPPTVTLTAPEAGSTVAGTIMVGASASDNTGVVIGVDFQLDGAPLAAEDTTAPYSVPWDTTAAANGTHTLTAVARDVAGHRTTSATVTVSVANDTSPPSVTLTSPAAGSRVTGPIRQRLGL